MTDTGWSLAASQDHCHLGVCGFSARPADFHRRHPRGNRSPVRRL